MLLLLPVSGASSPFHVQIFLQFSSSSMTKTNNYIKVTVISLNVYTGMENETMMMLGIWNENTNDWLFGATHEECLYENQCNSNRDTVSTEVAYGENKNK